MSFTGEELPPEKETPGFHRTTEPSVDAKLASNERALIGENASGEQPSDAKGLVYGRDTLISPRERAEMTRVLQRPPEQRQPSELGLITDLMTRWAVQLFWCFAALLTEQAGRLDSIVAALRPLAQHCMPRF